MAFNSDTVGTIQGSVCLLPKVSSKTILLIIAVMCLQTTPRTKTKTAPPKY